MPSRKEKGDRGHAPAGKRMQSGMQARDKTWGVVESFNFSLVKKVPTGLDWTVLDTGRQHRHERERLQIHETRFVSSYRTPARAFHKSDTKLGSSG